MASGMYPGIGLPLYRASDASTQEPAWLNGQGDPTIPTSKSSMGIALNPGLNTTLNVLYGTAPSGTAFTVMYDINSDFSTEFAIDTIAVVGSQKAYVWSTAGVILLSGFLRITNAGGTSITHAYGQQTAVTG